MKNAKLTKNLFKIAAIALSFCCVSLFISGAVLSSLLPSEINSCGGELNLSTSFPVSLRSSGDTVNVTNENYQKDKNAEIYLLDSIPIKQVRINQRIRKTVIPCGNPFGMKLYSNGAMIVEISEINLNGKAVCPASDAALKKGDVITKVNDKKIECNEDLINAVCDSKGSPLKIQYIRFGHEYTASVTPVLTGENGEYRIGVWVRDSTAGIGTITYYDSENNIYASLGHGICDKDTGELIPVGNGCPVNASIDSVTKSIKGVAGCLLGHFTDEIKNATIESNTKHGIFGYMESCPSSLQRVELAMKQEVKKGHAQILTTICGDTPKYYDVYIESINYDENSTTKNIVIKITDKELLEKTGGIVQGMSGSPIIQNNMLVGAVTHVFVNDPQRGYAIFAETMLYESEKIINNNSKIAG